MFGVMFGDAAGDLDEESVIPAKLQNSFENYGTQEVLKAKIKNS